MKETPQQYTARILGYARGRDALAVLAATPSRLARMVARRTARELTRPPAPGRWSVGEILAHLADAELVAGYRWRMMISHSGGDIQAFDQDRWAAEHGYARAKPRASLEAFAAMRAFNLRLLRSIPSSAWRRYGVHSERGKETVEKYARMMAGHDLNHLAQIERILKG